jgi:hypothetical protein
MTPEMSVVLDRAATLNLTTEIRDKRTLYIDSRPCQVIKSKWFENFPGCRAMTMYMPRSGFADFLLYVSDGKETYVVPRGEIAHDTAWSETALEPYKDAWHLLKETLPRMFERKVVSLSKQLQRVIAEAERHNLKYELIRSKKANQRGDYRTYKQRRILINGKRCAVYGAYPISNADSTCDAAYFSAPKDDWPEFCLYILNEDVYVIPVNRLIHNTTFSLDSSQVFDYRNAWCLLDGVAPTSWKEIREYRKRFDKS